MKGLPSWIQISDFRSVAVLFFLDSDFKLRKECVDRIISERGRTSMATDFKLRRNVLIGLYLRGDVLPWPQISNSEGMC